MTITILWFYAEMKRQPPIFNFCEKVWNWAIWECWRQITVWRQIEASERTVRPAILLCNPLAWFWYICVENWCQIRHPLFLSFLCLPWSTLLIQPGLTTSKSTQLIAVMSSVVPLTIPMKIMSLRYRSESRELRPKSTGGRISPPSRVSWFWVHKHGTLSIMNLIYCWWSVTSWNSEHSSSTLQEHTA